MPSRRDRPILSRIGVPSALAYSMRVTSPQQLRQPLLRVQRASDLAERDIWPDNAGVADVYALQDFAGASGTLYHLHTYHPLGGPRLAAPDVKPLIAEKGLVYTNQGVPLSMATGSSWMATEGALDISWSRPKIRSKWRERRPSPRRSSCPRASSSRLSSA